MPPPAAAEEATAQLCGRAAGERSGFEAVAAGERAGVGAIGCDDEQPATNSSPDDNAQPIAASRRAGLGNAEPIAATRGAGLDNAVQAAA